MPSLPPVAQVCKVVVRGSFDDTPWNNIFHLQYSGLAPNATDLNTMATNVLGAYTTAFAPLMAAGLPISECQISDLTSATAAQGEATVGTAGTRVGAANPASVAAVISWHINLRYRGGHPRTYVPAGTNDDLLNFTTWTSAFVTELDAAAGTFKSAMDALVTGATTYKLCIVSYQSGGAPRPQPLPFQINAHSVDSRVDTQRRRLGKDR